MHMATYLPQTAALTRLVGFSPLPPPPPRNAPPLSPATACGEGLVHTPKCNGCANDTGFFTGRRWLLLPRPTNKPLRWNMPRQLGIGSRYAGVHSQPTRPYAAPVA